MLKFRGYQPVQLIVSSMTKFESALDFENYLQSGEFSDVTVVVNEKQFNCHKLILAYKSDFFRGCLTSHFKEATSNVISLKFDHGLDSWPHLLTWMYTGTITIDMDNVFAINALASELLIKDVVSFTNEFLKDNITLQTVMETLQRSLEHPSEATTICIDMIASNFHKFYQEDFSFVPNSAIHEVFGHPKLYILQEYELYYSVVNYINSTRPPISEQRTLFSFVKFAFLPNEVLAQLEEYVIPKDMLLAGCVRRLKMLSNETVLEVTTDPLLTPRGSYVKKTCEPIVHEFTKTWANSIEVSTSGIGLGATSNILKKGTFATTNRPGSSINLRFPGSFIPCKYGFSHGGPEFTGKAKNWDLIGVDSAGNSRTILQHRNESTAHTATERYWTIGGEAVEELQLVSTGPQEGNGHALYVTQLKVWGLLDRPHISPLHSMDLQNICVDISKDSN